MSRIPPAFPSDLPNLNAPPSSWTVALRTVTPMFGGAATERQVDARHPIRPASVRGHLRFWWRATSGAGFTTAEQLFDAESALWGNTKTPGQVRVQVRVTDAGQQVRPIRHERRSSGKMMPDFGNYPAYALFPFQGTIKWGETEKAPDDARENVVFSVTLTGLELSDEQWAQVRTALNAWVLFGGIGSRTRRGCGSLELVEGTAAVPVVQGRGDRMLTTLPGCYYLGEVGNDPVKAWETAVRVYRDFRQGEGISRTPHQKPNKTPGRSYWPEPDRIRLLRDKYFEGTDRSGKFKSHRPHPDARGFPRADLGLPIIFHFKDEGHSSRHDPTDQELRASGERQKRFASPVITKCVAVQGGFAPLLMIMDGPRVWDGPGVVLIDSKAPRKTETGIVPNDLKAASRRVNPLPAPDIRESLVAHARKSGLTEVTL